MLEFKVLPQQREFIASTENTLFVAGFGSGKSHAGTLKTIYMKLKYPQHKVAYYLPSYPLVRDIAFDKFPTLLSELGLSYKLNKTDKEIHIENYGSIIFRSMENYETIVGYEVAYSLIDEADILPMDKMTKAYQKILGRNRAVDGAIVDAVSTPEGFKWLYEQSRNGNFRVIRARTTDNKFLPHHYIEELIKQYPKNLLDAYMNGLFVNLASGTVYSYFNRDTHNSDEVHNENETLIIGQDFNVGGCCSIVYVLRGSNIIAVDEFVSNDTKGIIQNIKDMYPTNAIEIYPDASGNSKKTNASETDISLLKNAGFKVYVNKSNPSVRDRINITNNMLDKCLLLVNVGRCRRFTEALEQQAYDKNGDPEKFSGAATIDDFTDAGTYPIAYKYPINKPSYRPSIEWGR